MKTQNTKAVISNPVVLVTGCASGVGLELAKTLYSHSKYRVVITAREKHLAHLKSYFKESDRFVVKALDITDDESIYRVVQETCDLWGRIDTIINNAAVCYRGVVEHMDYDGELNQLKTNYLGPMSLVRAVLPIMREQKSGQIINVSSASGILAMPTMGSYSASKHALDGATEALWYEAKPFGIKVNLIELGFLNSKSFKNVVLSKKATLSMALGGPLHEYYGSLVPFIERLMRLSPTTAEKVAQKILHTLEIQPTHLRIRGTLDLLVYQFLKRMLPSRVLNSLLYAFLPGSSSWGQKKKRRQPALIQ